MNTLQTLKIIAGANSCKNTDPNYCLWIAFMYHLDGHRCCYGGGPYDSEFMQLKALTDTANDSARDIAGRVARNMRMVEDTTGVSISIADALRHEY